MFSCFRLGGFYLFDLQILLKDKETDETHVDVLDGSCPNRLNVIKAGSTWWVFFVEQGTERAF